MMRESIENVDKNLKFNRDRWGNPDYWSGKDQYGYRWNGGFQQTVGGFAKFADQFLRPFVGERYDHRILELSPGGGRFTAELIRYAARIDLLDMNAACLDVCRERFKFFPIEMGFFQNDGRNCSVVSENSYSLIACFDSMVHMHPEIIHGYVNQLARCLEPGGVLWLDHSGKGKRDAGHRTEMTPEAMAGFGAGAGLRIVHQVFRNDHDCISVFVRD